MTISSHFKKLGATYKNIQWSNSARAETGTAFLRCWTHEKEVKNGRISVMLVRNEHVSRSKLGWNERNDYLKGSIEKGQPVFVVFVTLVQEYHDKTGDWKVKHLNKSTLYRVDSNSLTHNENGDMYATILESVPVRDYIEATFFNGNLTRNQHGWMVILKGRVSNLT